MAVVVSDTTPLHYLILIEKQSRLLGLSFGPTFLLRPSHFRSGGGANRTLLLGCLDI